MLRDVIIKIKAGTASVRVKDADLSHGFVLEVIVSNNYAPVAWMFDNQADSIQNPWQVPKTSLQPVVEVIDPEASKSPVLCLPTRLGFRNSGPRNNVSSFDTHVVRRAAEKLSIHYPHAGRNSSIAARARSSATRTSCEIRMKSVRSSGLIMGFLNTCAMAQRPL